MAIAAPMLLEGRFSEGSCEDTRLCPWRTWLTSAELIGLTDLPGVSFALKNLVKSSFNNRRTANCQKVDISTSLRLLMVFTQISLREITLARTEKQHIAGCVLLQPHFAPL